MRRKNKMRKQSKPWLFILGPCALVAGAIIKAFFEGSELDTATGSLLHLPSLSYMLIGFGSSLSAVGIVFFIVTRRMKKRNPERARQIEIEAKDERNVKLLEKSGYTTWYVTMITLVLLSLCFVALQLLAAFWLTVGVFAIHVTTFFICGYIYDKKM